MNKNNNSPEVTLTYEEFKKLPSDKRIELILSKKAPKKPEENLLLIPYNWWLPQKISPVKDWVNNILGKKNTEKIVHNFDIKKSLTPIMIDNIQSGLRNFIDWKDELIKQLHMTKDINTLDKSWKSALYYICYFWVESLIWFILQFQNIRNDTIFWNDMFFWTENWKWTPEQKQRILRILMKKFK